jgi:flagellar biosynthetic protein FlhB
MASLSALGVIAGLDYFWQRIRFMSRNRMSKQEIKEEYRQNEGDPVIKAKVRQIRQERARKRMMAAVPDATVVITNPTHFAVALKYESGKMQAPVCVAKGIDALALRIRAVAEENDVPVIENPPLARALHASVEIDEAVPPEHYKAVAQVIGYVMRLNGAMARR